MCISAITMIVGAAVSAASSLIGASQTAEAAKSEAQWKNYQLEMQNRQIKDEQDMTFLKAQQAEGDRLEQQRRLRATNEAFLAATGVDENISYLQGADEYNDQQTRRDISTIRLNSSDQISRMADQITVNKAEGQFATAKARMTAQSAWTQGILGAAGGAVKAFNSYSFYKGP